MDIPRLKEMLTAELGEKVSSFNREKDFFHSTFSFSWNWNESDS